MPVERSRGELESSGRLAIDNKSGNKSFVYVYLACCSGFLGRLKKITLNAFNNLKLTQIVGKLNFNAYKLSRSIL